jgi:hypothetical protein
MSLVRAQDGFWLEVESSHALLADKGRNQLGFECTKTRTNASLGGADKSYPTVSAHINDESCYTRGQPIDDGSQWY